MPLCAPGVHPSGLWSLSPQQPCPPVCARGSFTPTDIQCFTVQPAEEAKLRLKGRSIPEQITK